MSDISGNGGGGDDWQGRLERLLGELRRRLGRRAELTPDDRALVEEVAGLAVLAGQAPGADDLLHGLEKDNRQSGYIFAADYVALKRVHLALGRGRLEDALHLLEGFEERIGPLTEVPWRPEGLTAWEAACRWPPDRGRAPDRALFFSRLYLALGLYLAAQGQYGHAAALLGRGADHAGPDASEAARAAWRPLRLALARVLLEQGRPAECQRVFAALGDGAAPRTGPGWLVEQWELTAHCHLLCGEHGPALRMLDRVSEFCLRGGFARAALGALLNQAEVLVLVNQVRFAEELLDEAEALAATLRDGGGRARAAWLRRLADARARSPLRGLAIADPVTVMQKGRQPGAAVIGPDGGPPPVPPPSANFLAFFAEQALGVQWALADGDVALADDLLQGMRRAFAETDSPLIRLRLHALAGMVAYAAGDFAGADRLFADVIPDLEERGLRPDLWQTLRFRGWCSARLGLPAAVQQEWDRRSQQLVDEMAHTLPPEEMAVYLMNKWTVEERALKGDVERLARLKAAVAAAPWYARPWKRWQLWRRLYAFLHRLDDNRRQLARREVVGEKAEAPAAPAPPARLCRWLWRQRRDTATVSFLVLPDRTFVARFGWLSLDFEVLPTTRLYLRERVRAWHELVGTWEQFSVPAAEFDARAGKVVAALRLEDLLKPLPRRVRRLVIVADDSLHGFSFAAAPVAGRYLAERFALTMSYDRTARPRPAPGPPRRGLAVAVTRGVKGVAALPKAGDEAKDVAVWLESRGAEVRCLGDDGAGRAAVLRACEEADFLHAACHGTFVPDRPDASGLVLVPRPDAVEVLSLRDLARQDLGGLVHVTLSSCWGADNFVLPGRWIVSLPETLCRRGAGSVLACLWPVYGDVPRAFALRFYHHLQRMPRDRALQAAQQDCRDGKLAGTGKKAHPCYWGGYVLHGDPGPLRA